MKKLIYKLVDLYLSPLKQKASLALFAKHRILQQNEHLHAAVHMIRRNHPGATGTVIDVGAFNGSTTIFFAKSFPSSRVIGFEPNPATFPDAQKNCSPYPSITLIQSALDKENGELDFYVSNQNLSSSLNPITDNEQFHVQKKIKVKVQRLDDCIPATEQVLLIKLDTQGREFKILSSGEATLKNTRYILTEMNNHNHYEGGCMYYEVDEFLRKHNFKLVNITSGYNYAGLSEYDALYINESLK